MNKSFNKKVFVLVFVLIIVIFAIGETVFGLLPVMREKNTICQNIKEELTNYSDAVFNWLGEVKVYMEEEKRSSQEIYDELFDGLGMLKTPENIGVRAVIYTGGGSDAFGYWNVTPGRENELIFDYLTDVDASPVDSSRWIALDKNDAESLWKQICVEQFISEDIKKARVVMEPAFCGVGGASAAGIFIAYIPMSSENEALMAIIDGKSREIYSNRVYILNQGYGYSLVKKTSVGDVVVESYPDCIIYQTGDFAIDLPGETWYLDVYPFQSVISVSRIGLELIVAVLGAVLAAVLAGRGKGATDK